MSICGVLLFESAFEILGDALTPYVREGRIGKFIYCAQAVQNGSFIDMTFEPSQTTGGVKDRMVISIPVGYVKFMATGARAETLPPGFLTHSA